jgi:phosphatidylinositol glycan class A protein
VDVELVGGALLLLFLPPGFGRAQPPHQQQQHEVMAPVQATRKHRIAMVCDFFYPRLGGVEMHIWSLSQHLVDLGHHVVVLTHAYEDRVGVRDMTNSLRVYYLPFPPFAQENALPALYVSLPLVREVLVRERVDIVHGHQATSSMMHEALMHAKVLGLRTVFTDHSLFGFADLASIHLNKVLKFTLSNADMCIGVSQACRANLVLRASLDPARVRAIPNAVEAAMFTPDPGLRPLLPRVNVVVLSRLAYRKGPWRCGGGVAVGVSRGLTRAAGIDLVARVVPLACARWPHLHFIIGGGGPKRIILDEMVERHDLHERVELLGEVPHERVRAVLCRGSVFLNCSLTESFCIAILEAACCGLVVVSTDVGGISEVLDKDMIRFPAPGAESAAAGLVDALGEALALSVDPFEFHARLAARYSWRRVALQTCEQVYDVAAAAAAADARAGPAALFLDALDRYRGLGPLAGLLAVWVVAVDAMLLRALQWWRPDQAILADCLR